MALDLEIKNRDMVAAKIRDIQPIKVWATKGAIGGLTEQQVLNVLAKELDVTSGGNAIDTVGGVGRHVKVARRVKSHAVWDAHQPLREHFQAARTSVSLDFDSDHAIAITFHYV